EQKVQRLLIEEGSAIERELYLGLVLDRASAKVVFMASQSGGMEIEEVAHKTPELIYKEYIDPAVGFAPYQARKLAFKLGLKPTQINDAVKFMTGLYKAFVETDSTLMEINQYAGGSGADCLDVGGGAKQEQIENAFGILLSDPNVKAIFINIFGGILRVDVLATAVVAAAKKLNVQLPIILRLEGTNVEEGRKILAESGLKFQVGATMKEAAELAVAAAKGGK